MLPFGSDEGGRAAAHQPPLPHALHEQQNRLYKTALTDDDQQDDDDDDGDEDVQLHVLPPHLLAHAGGAALELQRALLQVLCFP